LPLLATSYCLETVDQLLLHRSKRPPTENETHPLDVKLGMYLESLGNFRSTEMSFDADIYVYMSWKDIRLAHNFSDYVLINDDSMRKQIWFPTLFMYYTSSQLSTLCSSGHYYRFYSARLFAALTLILFKRLPDLYFANARQAHFQEVTVPNFNMFIAPDGTVAYSLRCTLTVACNLDLRRVLPDGLANVLDQNAYIAKQVNVTWFDSNPIRSNPEIGLPEFMITAVAKSYCNGTYRYALMPNSYKLDNFSCLEGNLYLSRSIGYNLVQSYIPTGLIVMISWVSFWIDRRAVPARVTLSFTTLVSLTTLGNGLRFGLPQVSYVKAIDLWYGGEVKNYYFHYISHRQHCYSFPACMLFVFSALLEFAIINSYMRKSEKFDSMGKRIFSSIASGRSKWYCSPTNLLNVLQMWFTRAAVPSICSKQLECKDSNGFCEREKGNGNRQPIRFIDDVMTPSSKNGKYQTIVIKSDCRVSNAKSMGTSLLKRSPESENTQCIDNSYGNEEDNKRKMESSVMSIYDNVSQPWRNLDTALLEDEDSGSDNETSWKSCPSRKAPLRCHASISIPNTAGADDAAVYSK
ncbi:Neurotransmitter-gated ion-channel transmembrane region, partial [Ostertagia ostertagi]